MKRILAALVLAVAITTPAHATVLPYDQCGNFSGVHWSVSNSGSKACIDRGAIYQDVLWITPSIYDKGQGDYDATNNWLILQYWQGYWHTTRSSTCVVSEGNGYSNVCHEVWIVRMHHATSYALQIQACTGNICTGFVTKVNEPWN